MSKRRSRILWALAGMIIVIGIAAAAAGPIMSRVEQPKYQVTASNGPIELRSYGSMIAAEATVEGRRKEAINEGFALIAAYIFGANKLSDISALGTDWAD